MLRDGVKIPIHLSTYLRVKIKGIRGVLNVLKYNHTRRTLNRLRKAKNDQEYV